MNYEKGVCLGCILFGNLAPGKARRAYERKDEVLVGDNLQAHQGCPVTPRPPPCLTLSPLRAGILVSRVDRSHVDPRPLSTSEKEHTGPPWSLRSTRRETASCNLVPPRPQGPRTLPSRPLPLGIFFRMLNTSLFSMRLLAWKKCMLGRMFPVLRASCISASLRALSLWLASSSSHVSTNCPPTRIIFSLVNSWFRVSSPDLDVAGQKEDTTRASSREGGASRPDIDARMPGRGDHSAVDLSGEGAGNYRSKCLSQRRFSRLPGGSLQKTLLRDPREETREDRQGQYPHTNTCHDAPRWELILNKPCSHSEEDTIDCLGFTFKYNPGGSAGRVCLQCRRPWFDPWVRKIPWRREE